MKNRFLAGLTLLSFMGMGLPVAASNSAHQSGLVESQDGKVLVRKESGWNALDGSELRAGAQLRTGTDGEVVLHFPQDDSRIRVSANTDLSVVEAGPGRTVLKLERGRVLGRVGQALAIKTNRSETLATDGEFVLETTATGTKLQVLSGNARLASETGVKTPATEEMPEEFGSEALTNLDNVAEVQSEGDVTLVAAADEQEPQDNDDDEAGTQDGDDSTWAYVGAGGLVIGTIFLLSGDDDDDESVGNPSPSLP